MLQNRPSTYPLFFVSLGLVFTALVVVIFCYMAIQNWGLMNKSADDNETIEQAISRLISAHEEEPTSHMGAGESIDVHRKNTILDHPAGSVVGDKTPFSEYQENNGAFTEREWSVEDGSALSVKGTHIEASMFSQTAFQSVIGFRHDAGNDYPDADLIYQFSLNLNGFQFSDGYFKLAFTNDLPDDSVVMQFEKVGTTHIFKIKESGNVVLNQPISNAVNTRTIYRIYIEHLTNTLYLYEGATVVATYTATNIKTFIFNVKLGDWKSTFNFDVS